MISEGLNDARTDETNKADGNHKNVEEWQTTAPMVFIKKKVSIARRSVKDFNAQSLS